MSLPRGRHGHRVSPGSPPLTHPEGRAPRLRAWPWGVTTRLSAPHHRSHWPRGDGDDRSGPSPWRSGDSPSTHSSPEGLSGGFPVPGPGVAPSLGPGRSGRRQSGCGRRRHCQTRGQSCSPPPEPSHPNSRGAAHGCLHDPHLKPLEAQWSRGAAWGPGAGRRHLSRSGRRAVLASGGQPVRGAGPASWSRCLWPLHSKDPPTPAQPAETRWRRLRADLCLARGCCPRVTQHVVLC